MVRIHRNNILVPGDRPIGSEEAIRSQMNRVFFTQTLKSVPHLVLTPDFRIGEIDRLERELARGWHSITTLQIARMRRHFVTQFWARQGFRAGNDCIDHRFLSALGAIISAPL